MTGPAAVPFLGTSTLFRVATGRTEPATGTTTCIITVPPAVFIRTPSGQARIDVTTLGHVLRRATRACEPTPESGPRLHHADWVITVDPAVVEDAYVHKCPRCRAAVDQARARLAEHPDQPLLVGLLYWTGPPAE